ncbi:MAG TPA: hypothetical protein VK176_05440 [Phycisphaerales bacterium]|nr:hypothetical protein [Phycisphaerales bacterium]
MELTHNSVHSLSHKGLSSHSNHAMQSAGYVHLAQNCGTRLVYLTGRATAAGGSEFDLGILGEPSFVLGLSLALDEIESAPSVLHRVAPKATTHVVRMRGYSQEFLVSSLERLGEHWNLNELKIRDLTQGHAMLPFYDLTARFPADNELHVQRFEQDTRIWAKERKYAFSITLVDDNFGLGDDPGLPHDDPEGDSGGRDSGGGPGGGPWPSPSLPPLKAGHYDRVDSLTDIV